MEVLIDGDATVLGPLDARRVQAQIVDLGDTAGRVDNDVCFELLVLFTGAGVDHEAAVGFVDGGDLGAEVHFDAELAGGLDELADQARRRTLRGAALRGAGS